MSNEKQSSVEWLEIELQNNLLKIIRENRADLIESIFAKAKAMHMVEMIDFVRYLEGVKTWELELIDEYKSFYKDDIEDK